MLTPISSSVVPEVTISLGRSRPLDTGLEKGRKLYVIGDVHGMSSPLEKLVLFFKDDSDDNSSLIFLGDLIDKGTDSPGAMDIAISAEKDFKKVVYLMGNHEAMMRLFAERGVFLVWGWNSGKETLKQFGVPSFSNMTHKDILEKIGQERIDFLEGMQTHYEEGNLFFVHAGVPPREENLERFLAIPWEYMDDEWHWAWMRWPFLNSKNPLPGKVVVHGHTPVQLYDFKGRGNMHFERHKVEDGKMNLDGWSYKSGGIVGAIFTENSYKVVMALS